MQKKFAFYVILVVASIIICLGTLNLKRKGIPEVQGRIDQRLHSLVSESPSLKGLEVGRENGMHVIRDAASIKGWFQYYAKLNGSAVDLFVYWEKNSTNCLITKIEWSTTYSEPRSIWPTNEN